MSDEMKWARDLVINNAWMLYNVGSTVCRAKKLYEPGEFISPQNKLPVKDWVLETEEGHSFVARERNFVPLTEQEVLFYAKAQRMIAQACAAVVSNSLKDNIPLPAMSVLIIAALTKQTHVLQAEQAKHQTDVG